MANSKKRILILTNFSEKTNHSRLNHEISILNEAGYSVECFLGNKGSKRIHIKIIEKLLFKFINVDVLFYLLANRNKFDIFFFYGLFTFNALLFFPSDFRRKCIYQSLNHDVLYHTYELGIRMKFLKPFFSLLKPFAIQMEKYLHSSCASTIVNSESLKNKFPSSTLIYYTSPLEGMVIQHSPTQNAAFVYLGQLRKEKISADFFDYIEKHLVKFFVFGKIKDNFIQKKIESSDYCDYRGDLSIPKLQEALEELSKSWNLIGVSLIQEPHKSYQEQNANKDIDYLAIGMPIFGNYRNTTRELIEAGNGFFYDKFDVSRMTYAEYSSKSQNCLKAYEKYSNKQFKIQLLNIFSRL